MSRFMTVGLKRKVSLVLLPIDDFTDRIILGSQIRMYTLEGNRPAIRKSDGYHVFCDLEGQEAGICIEGPLYQRQTLTLPVNGETVDVYQVRMVPGPGYPIPRGATIVKGRLPGGSVIRLFFQEQKKSCKLLYDYDPGEQGRRLSLFQPFEMHLEGKTLCIGGKGKDREFFRVSAQEGETCLLEHPLSRAYRKIGTSIYPVYETAVREDGSFYLPIHSVPEEGGCLCMLRGTDGRESVCEVTLSSGRENWISEELWKEEK